MKLMEMLLELIGTGDSPVVKFFAVIGLLCTFLCGYCFLKFLNWFLENKFKSLSEENKKKK